MGGVIAWAYSILAKNAGYCRTTRLHAAENVHLVTHDLQMKGYPHTWWKPTLGDCRDKWAFQHARAGRRAKLFLFSLVTILGGFGSLKNGGISGFGMV